MVQMRWSSSRNKKFLRSIAIGGASIALCRCAVLFFQANTLFDVQVNDVNPFSLLHEQLQISSAQVEPLDLDDNKNVQHQVHSPDVNDQPSGTNAKAGKDNMEKSVGRPDLRYAQKQDDSTLKKLAVKTDADPKAKQPQHEKKDLKAKTNNTTGINVPEQKMRSRKRQIHVVKANDRTGQVTERYPYYLHGKYKFLDKQHDPRKKLIANLRAEKHKVIGPNVTTWALPMPLNHPTRNHDSVIVEGRGRRPTMLTLLGRYSRYIQAMDLITGDQWAKRTKGKDPSGNPIDDLNHVTAVLVDSLDSDGQEIWLPCGFHNDVVNKETSTDYVRIVDVNTMNVRVGPKLPVAGGACISKALSIIPNEPPMVCTFAGTQGHHDNGTFLPYTQCYDRVRQKWWRPFGNLPYGLDHGSLAVIPAGTCQTDDPARVLIFNFRTRPYGNPHPEFLAHDIPNNGWSLDKLKSYDKQAPKKWYVYHNVTGITHLKDVPRDASGVVTANNGRLILNFGGTFRTQNYTRIRQGKLRNKGRASMIRAFDVCRKEWSVVGDLGLQTFALQSCASDSLGVAVTCGGEAPLAYSNSPFCFVSRLENMTVANPQSMLLMPS